MVLIAKCTSYYEENILEDANCSGIDIIAYKTLLRGAFFHALNYIRIGIVILYMKIKPSTEHRVSFN